MLVRTNMDTFYALKKCLIRKENKSESQRADMQKKFWRIMDFSNN